MEEFMAKLNEYLAAAEAAVIGIAPDVWSATLFIIRMQGLRELAVGLLFFVPLAVYLWHMKRFLKWAKDSSHDSEGLSTVTFIIVSIIVILISCYGIEPLSSVNAWLSLLSPETAVVYRVGEQAGIF